jgi:hypothetical protein
VVNPFLYDLVESKLQINDIMLGISTGSLLPNDLKQSASNMIASYKNIFSKYSDNIYFDNKVMTELEKAFNDYSVYLRSFNERRDEASGNEVLATKMRDFMDKKSAILIEKIESVDSYLQEVSDEEKTALENTV